MRTKIVAIILLAIATSTFYGVMHGSIPRGEKNATTHLEAEQQSGKGQSSQQTETLDKVRIPEETERPSTSPAPKDPVTDTMAGKREETSSAPAKGGTNPSLEPPGEPAVKQQEEPADKSPIVPIPDAVEQKAASIAKKDVEATDFMKAAGVILGKLSLSEIKFLFDTASDDFWVTTPVEEIEKVRGIIFKKLTPGDIATLREMGKKYGRSMTILEPDIDVAKTKEKQIEAKKTKN